jgi:multidrug efflux pump subunit AcrB
LIKTGIVINDSIILVSVFRELRVSGMNTAKAAVEAAVRRSRAVLLTSITTVIGISPVLLEQDIQAQFLKPLIISLAFGISFATFIVLFLLPALLVGLNSLSRRFESRLALFASKPAVDDFFPSPDRSKSAFAPNK